jgi:iron-sulfur cluster repair protein YtfE (RIC family)
MGNVNKKRELQYLLEDLVKDLAKLRDEIYVGPYEQSLIEQVNQKFEQLRTIHLGQTQILDSIQYTLGELRVGLEEWEGAYALISNMTDDIQDFLDWEDTWK